MGLIVDIVIAIVSCAIEILLAIGTVKGFRIKDDDDSCWDVKEDFNHYEDDEKIVWYSDGKVSK